MGDADDDVLLGLVLGLGDVGAAIGDDSIKVPAEAEGQSRVFLVQLAIIYFYFFRAYPSDFP